MRSAARGGEVETINWFSKSELTELTATRWAWLL